jgi:putative phosphoribosyl transferase
VAVVNLKQLVHIPVDGVMLDGEFVLPEGAEAVVIFAHGSGSSRHSPRNKFVAEALQEEGLGTLLFDLLTPEDDMLYANRFNIPLLTDRLKAATLWLEQQPKAKGLAVGYFGASTGAAAALWAAADLGKDVRAVVSRGGRPDLADPVLDRVVAPTLLIVGERDYAVIDLNREAWKRITAVKDLKIIAGATHLFEERGALEQVAYAAAEWFIRHLLSTERKSAA